jgi:hypothetical protein
VLVLPDAAEAAVKVIAEGDSAGGAEQSAEDMAGHISHLIAAG